MLTACLAVGGLIIRLAIRADAAERRRPPNQPQPPTVTPRDPRTRTGADIRELSTRTPSAPGTTPRERVWPPEPEDARPVPQPHRPGPRSAEELRHLFAREP